MPTPHSGPSDSGRSTDIFINLSSHYAALPEYSGLLGTLTERRVHIYCQEFPVPTICMFLIQK